jgi:hypothetical protein
MEFFRDSLKTNMFVEAHIINPSILIKRPSFFAGSLIL